MTIALLLAVTLAGTVDDAAATLWRKSSGVAIEEALLIGPAEFSEAHIISLCQSYLSSHREAAIIRLLITTDKRDAFDSLRGPGVSVGSYTAWRKLYMSQPSKVPSTAEMIRIRNHASVRIRFTDGRIAERVLERASPFLVFYQGMTLRVVGVTIDHLGPSPRNAELFIQSPRPLSKTTAEAFSRHLRKSIGIPRLAITIEDGWWFADRAYYPIYNRFLPYLQPPTLEEFKRHYRFYCADLDGQCLQSGPAR